MEARASSASGKQYPSSRRGLLKRIVSSWQVYLFLLPALIYYIVFHYAPMYGVQIAFKNYNATAGIWGSPFAGLTHFMRLLDSYQFMNILKNTVLLSVENLIFGFPIPIIFALLLNQITRPKIKKFIQTVSYAPYFISTVVIVAIILVFTYLQTGVVNNIIAALGFERIQFMAKTEWFRPLYIISGVWQNTGWDSIIYIAALSGISPELHEAAMLDGANKFQRIWHIDIPGILPTAVILFILRFGQLMRLGFEKAFLMQTNLNIDASEIISTYVYKMGVRQGQFSFAAATDLFNSVVNLVLIVSVNKLCRLLGREGLW
ncbi:MAG: ABC transporter permease subunit [Oscillospiraceae bacterium]|nr:ABC transporter permease subunit [Oscillospiraceae bacterium]